jgi:hypothetical protein
LEQCVAQIAQTRVWDPKTLPEADLTELTDQLFAVQAQVFDGVDRAAFETYVVRSDADRTEIKSFHDADDRVVGYVAFHFFDIEVDGQDIGVVRYEMGLLRAYRGGSAVGTFVVSNLLRTGLRWSHKPLYFLGCLVHPSSYSGVAAHAQQYWPRHDEPTPPEIVRLATGLAEHFHLDVADPHRPLVRQVGWVTRDTPAEQAYWRDSPRPHVRYFVDANPTYHRGHGLLTLVPLDAATISGSALKWGSSQMGKRLKSVLNLLTPLSGSAATSKAAMGVMAETIELFEGVEPASAIALFERGKKRFLAPGEVLFRQGAAGNSVFVLLSGSVYIVLEDVPSAQEEDDGQVIVDQLDQGEAFGELALLTGAPRSATVRAANHVELLEIGGRAAWDFLDEHPEVLDALWTVVARHKFSHMVVRVPKLSGVLNAEREAWFDAGAMHVLEPGGSVALVAGAHVLVVDGRATHSCPDGWASLAAPSLATSATESHIRSEQGARVYVLEKRPTRAELP